jgi:glycosyltransferase involved in cell wall biosynthesis
MNIAYASADFGIQVFGGKGASVHIQEMIKAFTASDHRVDIIAPQTGEPPAGLKAFVHRVVTVPPPVSQNDLNLATDSDRIFKERRNLAAADSVERELLRLHATRPFDFIYERYSLWSAAGVKAARKLGIPLVLEVNAPLLLEQKKYRKLVLSPVAEAVERECFENADLIFAVSNEVRNYAISNGAAPSRTHVQPNGVDLNHFNPDGSFADVAGSGKPIVGFSGSLRPWHGLEDLVRAVHLLHWQGYPCHLLIVGDGPLRGWIDGYVEGAGIQDFITITGWVPHERIPDYIRRMDVATAPYPVIEDFYFSPLKLFEYMACGRAVAASDIGQIGEVIDHGKNGLLCPPGHPEALAATIKELLDSVSLRRSLGAAARQSMIGRSWRDCAQRVADEVERLQVEHVQRRAS